MSGDFETLTTFYAAYRRFQEICDDPENQLRFRLQPGQLMSFDNRRVLHGRDAFDPESGHRLLRGCYGEREEVESRLRILYRAQRAQKNTRA
jgi:gamma-butyrobetaine dioxygenase